MDQSTIIKQGNLRKKKSKVTNWGERYFILRSNVLEYYVKQTDSEPKGIFPLQSNCQVSKITTDVGKKRTQYVFKVSLRIVDDEIEDKDEKDAAATENNVKDTTKAKGSKKKLASDGAATKTATAAVGGTLFGALTAGVGLLSGMVLIGMGSGSNGNNALINGEVKERSLVLGCDTYQEALSWVDAIEFQVQELAEATLGQCPSSNTKFMFQSKKSLPHPEVRIDDVEDWITNTRWKVVDTFEGLRILEPWKYNDIELPHNEMFFHSNSSKNIDVVNTPCMRVNLNVNASSWDAFSAIMNFSNPLKSGIVHSIRVVENIDNGTDVIHMRLNPVYLQPTWTAPRDFCLLRYWRNNNDGSFLICLDSISHNDCPVVSDFVRGEMHGAYVIVPPKIKTTGYSSTKDNDEEEISECMISFIAQVDPKGWLWSSFGYQNNFLKELMLHVFDIRDALESERFLQAHFDPIESSINTVAVSESVLAEGSIGSIPPPVLMPSMWTEPDASSFRIRGETYNADKVKKPSAPSLFKLVAIDFFEVPEPTPNISAHPRNRVSLALQRGDPAWVFVVNIMVPGPPYLSFVAYMEGDKSLIYADTPFGRVAKPFFDGNDDEFRNNRFKLIPKIVDGNMIVKMAVKDTPTLLGNKLKQYYHKGENYFELDVDVGSSSVARNVVGLAMGYSKAIVVEMGFCLQGNEEDELPEVLMGGCTCVNVDASTAKKL